MATSSDTSDPDPDPIVASYPVFLKPSLPAHQKLLVLKHVIKRKNEAMPPLTDVRIKPGVGMLEVDTPLYTTGGYDRAKGMAWGTALAASTKAKAGGSHGLAGGFGIGGAQGRGRSRATADDDANLEWNDAMRQDKVLRKTTLGGVLDPPGAWGPRYMVGVIQDQNLHLTPITSIVLLRPQLHHLDAVAELERAKTRADAATAGAGTAAAGDKPTARGVHTTIKATGADGSETQHETVADRLKLIIRENWSVMESIGDERDDSWCAFEDNLVLGGAATAQGSNTASKTGGKGKGKEKDDGRAGKGLGKDDLVLKFGSLETDWVEANILQAIKADTNEGDEMRAEPDEDAKSRDKAREELKQESPKKGRPGRPKGSTSARGRGGSKARVASSKSNAMEID